MKYDKLFFEFIYVKAEGDPISISGSSLVCANRPCYAETYAKQVVSALPSTGIKTVITLEETLPSHIIAEAGERYEENDESYALEIKFDTIRLYGKSHRGLIYAVSTLKQLIEANAVREMVLYDHPDKKLRGYRVYTPGREHFDAFKKMVDMLVYYKYNAINIEIGGAMEYKKHPEINAKWVEFCKEVHQSPYEAERIQKKTHPQWQKNSIHADNGDGSFITQDEMRELINYCRERDLTVIPEVPTLSHSDYIVMAHPEINERKEDTYPDTYCPSNPKSYALAFDILDEVISVFQPQYINIGHDECYTLAKCELCKDKDPVDLYVGDIAKINDYLKSKGIRSIMWSEKLWTHVYLPDKDGVPRGYGGTGEKDWDVPRMEGVAGRIPKDVILMQWYWSFCSYEQEKEVCDMGYTMIYGNFSAVNLTNYRQRIGLVSGGFVSNWGSFEPEYMQRNGQNFFLLTTAWIFWNRAYDASQRASLLDRVKGELYHRHKLTLGEAYIELTHTTSHKRPYRPFYDGYYIVPEDWTLGWHEVTYTDDTMIRLPVLYGYNIGCAEDEEQALSSSEEAVATSYVEVMGAAYPFRKNDKIYYKTAYNNPFPEKTIASIHFVSKDGTTVMLCTD